MTRLVRDGDDGRVDLMRECGGERVYAFPTQGSRFGGDNGGMRDECGEPRVKTRNLASTRLFAEHSGNFF